MPNPAKNRFAYLDGLRGWAALLVVFHHGIIAIDFALYTGQPSESRGRGDLWLSGTPFVPLAASGNLAVCIFFALSGFVLTHAYINSRQYWLSLVARRYLRLGLPMLAGCLFAWMLLLRWYPHFGQWLKLGLLLRRTDLDDEQTETVFGRFQSKGCS